MNADRFAEVERLYHEAMARPSAERAAFLNEACAGDDALRRDVESLMSFDTAADGFLSRPALEEAARAGQRPSEPHAWPTIPGYTVKRVLGEGGMGVVYLAEQETPLRRLVALKLIKPGMDTRQVVARFETERQALALMDHPNIAAVFDAGSTDDGRPYFVMEFVEGVTITEYCDRGRLSTRDRLALFVQVCAAVQHAHQKGVIHRDLKPSNVLITERDGQPLPKVIDFGTAKAIGGDWNVTVAEGGLGMVIGTLEYMSPEQAALSADIDTATDVYSLGVLLYELLVGRLPFDTDELRTAGYDEIRRVIRESDPPKPSVRVEQRTGAAAEARQTDAPGLTRQLRGDLDWITLKALEKDRKRRYATVAAFATDIGRFLDDEPVDARPPSSTYRIRKFTRRHRLAVASVAAILAILAAALAVTGRLYWQVRAALEESTTLAYTATLAAAADELRNGASAEARERLLTIAERLRGWEWRHLFIQTDESVVSFAAVAPSPEGARAAALTGEQPKGDCGPGGLGDAYLTSEGMTTALTVDPDGESILLRRCLTLQRWTVRTLAHVTWSAPPKSIWILAENSRGQVLTMTSSFAGPYEQSRPQEFGLVLTDRAASAAPAAFGPLAGRPRCAEISPDGTRIAFGLATDWEARKTPAPEVFEVWNAATRRFEFRLVAGPPALADPSKSTPCLIRFSPDGRRIATSGATVHVWDAVTGAERAADLLHPGRWRQAIAFSRGGNRLAIGRPSGLVDVLEMDQSSPSVHRLTADGRMAEEYANRVAQTSRVDPSGHEVIAVAFSPDDQTVVSGSSRTVGVWNIADSKLVRLLSGHTTRVVDVAVSVDGRRIYSVDTAGVVRGWPSSSAPAVIRIPGSHPRPNGGRLVVSTGAGVIVTATTDDVVTTIRLADLHQEDVPQAGLYVDLAAALAISPDGLRVFAAQRGGSIRRWTIGSQESVAVSTSQKAGVSSLAVSPSGALLASSQGNSVSVWDATTMKPLATLDVEGTREGDLLFRDEQTLIVSTATTSPDQKPQRLIRLWDWRTNRVLATVEPTPSVGPQNAMWKVALSPDGRRIALISFFRQGTPSTVSIWDRDLKTELGRLPPGDLWALAFSPDGHRIVTVGNQESDVRIWDADRLRLLMTLPDTDTHWNGVAVTAAGQIVAGRTGGGLTIWNTQIRSSTYGYAPR